MSVLPENMIAYTVFLEGERKLGTASIDLPSLDALSEKVKGAGIAGEVDAPVIGLYAAFGLTISWRTITADLAVLAAPVAHALEFRADQQCFDSSAGKFTRVPVKIAVRAIPKKTSLGKLVTAGQTDSKNEFEVYYIKVTINGEEKLELSKYDFICKINGVDYLTETRQNLGLE